MHLSRLMFLGFPLGGVTSTKPPAFAYVVPQDVPEVLAALARYGGDAKLLAGGQSLIPLLNFRLARPSVLISLNAVAELAGIRPEGAGVYIGAMTRQRAVERSALLQERLPILPAAVRHIAHIPIRNRGTIGGSLAHNDPAAELPLVHLLLEAECEIGRQGSPPRRVPMREFLVTYMTTVLEPEDLLLGVYLPYPPKDLGWSFAEVARRSGDFALVAAGCLVGRSGDVVDHLRLVVGGLGPLPIRLWALERQAVEERWPLPTLLRRAREAVAELEAEGDLHASAAVRRHLARELCSVVLTEAWQRAERKEV